MRIANQPYGVLPVARRPDYVLAPSGRTRPERLEAELEERGHLDRTPPLDLEIAWGRVLGRLAGQTELEPTALRARFEFLRARFDEGQTR